MMDSVNYPHASCDEIWIPLMIGLLKRESSCSSEFICDLKDKTSINDPAEKSLRQDTSLAQKTVIEFHAEQVVVSWIAKKIENRRKKKAKMSSGDNGTEQKNTGISIFKDLGTKFRFAPFYSRYFLLRALTSPTLSVRRLAAQILLDSTDPMNLVKARIKNCPLCYKGSTTIDISGRILLRNLLWSVAKRDLDLLVTYSSLSDSINSSEFIETQEAYVMTDAIIQVYGLLAHVVCDDHDAWYANNYLDSVLEGRANEKLQLNFLAIESFLASGGLRWITASLVRLISILLREDGIAARNSCDLSYQDKTFSETPRVGDLPMNRTFTEAIQVRIILLVDLCSRIVCHVSLYPIQFPEGFWNVATCPTCKNSQSSRTSTPPQHTQSKLDDGMDVSRLVSKAKLTDDASHLPLRKKNLADTFGFKGHFPAVLPGTIYRDGKLPAQGKTNCCCGPTMQKFDVEDKINVIDRIEYRRNESAKRTLCRAHNMLWSSTIPSIHIVDKPSSFPKNISEMSVAATGLSPLACLIASHAVLKFADDSLEPHTRLNNTNRTNVSSFPTLRSSHPLQPRPNDAVMFDDIPLLLSRVQGMDRCVELLKKVSDPSGYMTFAPAVYDPSPSKRTFTGTCTDKNTVSESLESNNSHGIGYGDDILGKVAVEVTMKRGPSTITASPNKRSKSHQQENSTIRMADASVSNVFFTDMSDLGKARDGSRLFLEERQSTIQSIQPEQIDGDSRTKLNELVVDEDEIDSCDDEDMVFGEKEDEEGEDVDDSEDDGTGSEHMGTTEGEDEDTYYHNLPLPIHDVARTEGIFDTAIVIKGSNRDRVERISSDGIYGHLPSQKCRNKYYISACMDILHAQHQSKLSIGSDSNILSSSHCCVASPILTLSAEEYIVRTVCHIVKPPKQTLDFKIFSRRAPTQEEFFRGSLTRNPIYISQVKIFPSSSQAHSVKIDEPRVRDLRQHIANELHMADSSDLLELLVANKIVDLDLKLRVVFQVLWKKHVLENSASTAVSSSSFLSRNTSGRMMSTGAGMSLVFSFTDSNGSHSLFKKESTDNPNYPPMVVTYRLAGVDGEATEERVGESDLLDPEIQLNIMSAGELCDQNLEKEFGLTRFVTSKYGVQVLLSSFEASIDAIIRKIHRDNVKGNSNRRNMAKVSFLKSEPCSALVLLRHCSRLKENRKKMFEIRAPTKLLRILLSLLNAIDARGLYLDDSVSSHVSAIKVEEIDSCPTTKMLQELIETITSDINEETTYLKENMKNFLSTESTTLGIDDDASLRMVLSSLRTASLSLQMKSVVSKLLPFLTYGQAKLSKLLAREFVEHVRLDFHQPIGDEQDNGSNLLTETFIECVIHLPATAVCNSFRHELLLQGFVTDVKDFVLKGIPGSPPFWSCSLHDACVQSENNDKTTNEANWRSYFGRVGLTTAFRILTSLATKHSLIKNFLCDVNCSEMPELISMNPGNFAVTLTTACHWIESTNDYLETRTFGLGILAETLLDTLAEENEASKKIVVALRTRTRDRKKEIADEKRNKKLAEMNRYVVGMKNENIGSNYRPSYSRLSDDGYEEVHKLRNTARQINSLQCEQAYSTYNANHVTNQMPEWMQEMEAMEDESGPTCIICQEGCSLQPTELLGLYSFSRKTPVPCTDGLRIEAIEGFLLLRCLPHTLPDCLLTIPNVRYLFEASWSAIDVLRGSDCARRFKAAKAGHDIRNSLLNLNSPFSSSPSYSMLSSSETSSLVSTVSAGNVIHCKCHVTARVADRNNLKAPKNEWEGATLRNARVLCNLIIPLTSPACSKVPSDALEAALGDFERSITKITGSPPKSMLWITLHDIRFLFLRMAHGESMVQECGGGTLCSNSFLMFSLIYLAVEYLRRARTEQPESFFHALGLSTGFLVARKIIESTENGMEPAKLDDLKSSVADAAPMAVITCMIFGMFQDSNGSLECIRDSSGPSLLPISWGPLRETFFLGLIYSAGRRYALGIDYSGCEPSRNSQGSQRARSSSFHEWGKEEVPKKSYKNGLPVRRQCYELSSSIDDFSNALRPMITLFILLDNVAMSLLCAIGTEQTTIEEKSKCLASLLASCLSADSLSNLMRHGNIPAENESILDAFHEGCRCTTK